MVIIDDESAFTDFMNKLIDGLGYEVIVSTDARSSYIYELRDSDIVFIDMMMPNMDGLQVLEKLFRQEAKCSIVLMSGQGERLEAAEKLAKQLDLRLIGAFKKPFRLRDILDVLEGSKIPSVFYLASRRELALTFLRYLLTTLSPDAPNARRPPSIPAVMTFSEIIRLASLCALAPPAASRMVRNQITCWDSAASISRLIHDRYMCSAPHS